MWILGSKEPDRLAKEGVIGVPSGQTTVIAFSVGKKLIKRHVELGHQAKWDACTG